MARAQSPTPMQAAGVMAEATEADYRRDPARWGSAEMAAHFAGFKHLDMRTSGAVIRLRHEAPMPGFDDPIFSNVGPHVVVGYDIHEAGLDDAIGLVEA